ncbi:hypothetical protein C7S16_6728 [Burkholderia thailandensis]|uniref:Transposase n=1 Tax=Burkholderia thailandensis TaxID=57975 RepID=A0AAW9CX72_BURTH|nr:hypothetical protein [Burkholderia thailandensis]
MSGSVNVGKRLGRRQFDVQTIVALSTQFAVASSGPTG